MCIKTKSASRERPVPTGAIMAFALLIYSGGAWGAEDTRGCLHYDSEVVTLRGIVTIQPAFGPPNFGEDPAHDAREDYADLRLDRPICVTTDGSWNSIIGDTVHDVMDLQLVYPDHPAFDRKLWGRPETLTGTLSQSFTAHEHTAVLLTVKQATK